MSNSDEENQRSESPDIYSKIKKFKKRYPIIYTIIAIVSFFIGAGLSGTLFGLTRGCMKISTSDTSNDV